MLFSTNLQIYTKFLNYIRTIKKNQNFYNLICLNHDTSATLSTSFRKACTERSECIFKISKKFFNLTLTGFQTLLEFFS